MAVKVRIVTTFPRRDTTPEAILWEGVLEWVNPEVLSEAGYPQRVLKIQCGMRSGQNGPFLTMPYIRRLDAASGRLVAVKDPNGRYRNYVDIGPGFQRSGVAAVQELLAKPTVGEMGDLREAARQTFEEAGGDGGTEFDDMSF